MVNTKKRLQKVRIEARSGLRIPSLKRIKPLREKDYFINELSVAGDAPKDFISVYEYKCCVRSKIETWPKYIAKVGHKWYPNESITEQLLTEIGKLLGVNIADSRLLNVKDQIRFLSRYFLDKDLSLVHGAEILADYLEDKEFVEEMERHPSIREIFTFQVTEKALQMVFPNSYKLIMCDLVKMLAFDAIVGNNDRHFYNWGVIIDNSGTRGPQFSPVYDSARALFWNDSDEKLLNKSQSKDLMEKYIEKYTGNSKPKIGWDKKTNVTHFNLISLINKNYVDYVPALKVLQINNLENHIQELVSKKFGDLFTKTRQLFILKCLEKRVSEYRSIVW